MSYTDTVQKALVDVSGELIEDKGGEDEDVSRKAVGVQIDTGLDHKDHYIAPAEASLWRDFPQPRCSPCA